jgi:hypothetical protein
MLGHTQSISHRQYRSISLLVLLSEHTFIIVVILPLHFCSHMESTHKSERCIPGVVTVGRSCTKDGLKFSLHRLRHHD